MNLPSSGSASLAAAVAVAASTRSAQQLKQSNGSTVSARPSTSPSRRQGSAKTQQLGQKLPPTHEGPLSPSPNHHHHHLQTGRPGSARPSPLAGGHSGTDGSQTSPHPPIGSSDNSPPLLLDSMQHELRRLQLVLDFGPGSALIQPPPEPTPPSGAQDSSVLGGGGVGRPGSAKVDLKRE